MPKHLTPQPMPQAQSQDMPSPPPFKQWADKMIEASSSGAAKTWEDLDTVLAPPEAAVDALDTGKPPKEHPADKMRRDLVKQYVDNELPKHYRDPAMLRQAQAYAESSLAPHLMAGQFREVNAAKKKAGGLNEMQSTLTEASRDASLSATKRAKATISLEALTRLNAQKIIKDPNFSAVDDDTKAVLFDREIEKRKVMADEIVAKFSAGELDPDTTQAQLDLLAQEVQNFTGAKHEVSDINDFYATVPLTAFAGAGKAVLGIGEFVSRSAHGIASAVSGKRFADGFSDNDAAVTSTLTGAAASINEFTDSLDPYDDETLATNEMMKSAKEDGFFAGAGVMWDNPSIALNIMSTTGTDSIAQLLAGGAAGKAVSVISKAGLYARSLKDIANLWHGATTARIVGAMGAPAVTAGLGDAKQTANLFREQVDQMPTDKFLSMPEIQADKTAWMNMSPEQIAEYKKAKVDEFYNDTYAATAAATSTQVAVANAIGLKFGLEGWLLGTGVRTAAHPLIAGGVSGVLGAANEIQQEWGENGIQQYIVNRKLNRDFTSPTPFDNYAGTALIAGTVGFGMDGFGGAVSAMNERSRRAEQANVDAARAESDAANQAAAAAQAAAAQANVIDQPPNKFQGLNAEQHKTADAQDQLNAQAAAQRFGRNVTVAGKAGLFTYNEDGMIVLGEHTQPTDQMLADPKLRENIDAAYAEFNKDGEEFSVDNILTDPKLSGYLTEHDKRALEVYNNAGNNARNTPEVRARAKHVVMSMTGRIRAEVMGDRHRPMTEAALGANREPEPTPNVGYTQGYQGLQLVSPEAWDATNQGFTLEEGGTVPQPRQPAGDTLGVPEAVPGQGSVNQSMPNWRPYSPPSDNPLATTQQGGNELVDWWLDPNLMTAEIVDDPLALEYQPSDGLPPPTEGAPTPQAPTPSLPSPGNLIGYGFDDWISMMSVENAKAMQSAMVGNDEMQQKQAFDTKFADELDAASQRQAQEQAQAEAEAQANAPIVVPASRKVIAAKAMIPINKVATTVATSGDDNVGAQINVNEDGAFELVLSSIVNGELRAHTANVPDAVAQARKSIRGATDPLKVAVMAREAMINRLRQVMTGTDNTRVEAAITYAAYKEALSTQPASYGKMQLANGNPISVENRRKRVSLVAMMRRQMAENLATMFDGAKGRAAMDYVTGRKHTLGPKLKAHKDILDGARRDWHEHDSLLAHVGTKAAVDSLVHPPKAEPVEGETKKAARVRAASKAKETSDATVVATSVAEVAESVETGVAPPIDHVVEAVEIIVNNDPMHQPTKVPTEAEVATAINEYNARFAVDIAALAANREAVLARDGNLHSEWYNAPPEILAARERTRAPRQKILQMQLAQARAFGGNNVADDVVDYDTNAMIETINRADRTVEQRRFGGFKDLVIAYVKGRSLGSDTENREAVAGMAAKAATGNWLAAITGHVSTADLVFANRIDSAMRKLFDYSNRIMAAPSDAFPAGMNTKLGQFRRTSVGGFNVFVNTGDGKVVYLSPERTARLMMHEMAHAATFDALVIGEELNTQVNLGKIHYSTLTPQENAYLTFHQEIGTVRQQVVEHLARGRIPGKAIGGIRGLLNNAEFAAELSNAEFRDILNNIYIGPERVSMLTKVMSFIGKLFGVKAGSALDKSMESLQRMWDSVEEAKHAEKMRSTSDFLRASKDGIGSPAFDMFAADNLYDQELSNETLNAASEILRPCNL